MAKNEKKPKKGEIKGDKKVIDRRLANLTPFEKGHGPVKGNGRPKGSFDWKKVWSKALRKSLGRQGEAGKLKIQELADAMIDEAIENRNTAAARWATETTQGTKSETELKAKVDETSPEAMAYLSKILGAPTRE